MHLKWFYLVGGFFEPFHRFLAILLNSMPMKMFQTHFIRDLRTKLSKKCGLTGHKAVNGSRNLMLSSIISKMCVAFSELYSLSEPKISPECFPWDYVAIYVNDNFWILMTEKVLQTSPEIYGPNRLYPRTILYSLYTGPGLEKLGPARTRTEIILGLACSDLFTLGTNIYSIRFYWHEF